ncbi:MAG: MerR family transcriptional regulator [Actinobacteria bacterium]|nr:MAG: MerR family transcriptional regulator [Actinomycetota bacterium]REK40011.1 MAG: MerR family transcriptional regulator [Actinomycetota bacterium]
MESEALGRLLPIGAFSNMTRLSIKALRLYDDMGILSPAHVDQSSGYRYYTRGQANRAEAIRLLRGVDMPLDEISEVLEAEPDVARKLLDAHRDRLVDRLGAHQRMLAFLNDLLDGKERLMPYEVNVKTVQDQRVAALRKHATHQTIGDEIAGGFATLMQAVMSSGTSPNGAPLIIFHDVIDEQNDGDIEICIPIGEANFEDGEVVARTLPGGPMAFTMHKGPYQEVTPAYHALLAWIDDRGHATLAGPREIYLNDPTQVEEEELLTEIQWPIDTAEGDV